MPSSIAPQGSGREEDAATSNKKLRNHYGIRLEDVSTNYEPLSVTRKLNRKLAQLQFGLPHADAKFHAASEMCSSTASYQIHGSEQFTLLRRTGFCVLSTTLDLLLCTSEYSIYANETCVFSLGNPEPLSDSSCRYLKMDVSSVATSNAPTATNSANMSMGSSSRCKISMLWNWYTVDACTLPW